MTLKLKGQISIAVGCLALMAVPVQAEIITADSNTIGTASASLDRGWFGGSTGGWFGGTSGGWYGGTSGGWSTTSTSTGGTSGGWSTTSTSTGGTSGGISTSSTSTGGTPVPEPGMLGLMGGALLALGFASRRRRKAA